LAKLFTLVSFEIRLMFLSHYFGPYFTVLASVNLALDAWRDDGTKNDDGTKKEKTPAEKNDELNGKVLSLAEAIGESTPQLIVQTVTFWYEDQSYSDAVIFLISAAVCVVSILYAVFNMATSFREILERMTPPRLSIVEMRALGFTAGDALSVGFGLAEVKEAGLPLNGLKEDLKDAGMSARDLKNADFTARDLKEAGFSAREAKAEGMLTSALDAVMNGYSSWPSSGPRDLTVIFTGKTKTFPNGDRIEFGGEGQVSSLADYEPDKRVAVRFQGNQRNVNCLFTDVSSTIGSASC